MSFVIEEHTFRKAMIEGLVQTDDHDHAGFDGDPKQRDVSNPRIDAEVATEQHLEDQPSGHGVERG